MSGVAAIRFDVFGDGTATAWVQRRTHQRQKEADAGAVPATGDTVTGVCAVSVQRKATDTDDAQESVIVGGVLGLTLAPTLAAAVTATATASVGETAVLDVACTLEASAAFLGQGDTARVCLACSADEWTLQLQRIDQLNAPLHLRASRDLDRLAAELKEAGSALFAQQHWRWAAHRYAAAVKMHRLARAAAWRAATSSPDGPDALAASEVGEGESVLAAALCNLAACHLKLAARPGQAVGVRSAWHARCKGCCDEALAVQPDNSKALFRRGQAQAALRDYAPALQDLEAAAALVPGSAPIQRALQAARAQKQAEDARLGKALSSMFQ